jgi:hypothetical protein
MSRTIAAVAWGVTLAAMCLLGACGYFKGSPSARSAAGAPEAALQPLDPAAKALAGMVDAVGPADGEIPVEFKFSIRNRPEVGADDEVDYAIIPQIPGIERLHVVFGALDGIEVTRPAPSLAAIRPDNGTPIFGSVTIRPVKTGLFTLTAAIGVRTANRSLALPFRMPIIAGEGPTQTAARQP